VAMLATMRSVAVDERAGAVHVVAHVVGALDIVVLAGFDCIVAIRLRAAVVV